MVLNRLKRLLPRVVLDTITTRFLLLFSFVIIIPMVSMLRFSSSIFTEFWGKTAQNQLMLSHNLALLHLDYTQQQLAANARMIRPGLEAGRPLSAYCPAGESLVCIAVNPSRRTYRLSGSGFVDQAFDPSQEAPPLATLVGNLAQPAKGAFYVPLFGQLYLFVAQQNIGAQEDNWLLLGRPLDDSLMQTLHQRNENLPVSTWVLRQDSAPVQTPQPVLYARSVPPVSMKLPEIELVRALRQTQPTGPQSLKIYPEAYDVCQTLLYDPAHHPVARLVTILPKAHYYRLLEQFYDGFSLIFVCALLLSALVAIAVSRTITGPLLRLIDEVNTLSYLDGLKDEVRLHGFHEINRLSSAFNQLLKRLRQEHQMRDEFVATLTHDLKVPMLAEKQTLAYFRQEVYGPLNDTQREVLDVLQASNQSSLTLVNGLLEVSRYDAGRMRLMPEPVDVGQLLVETMLEIRPLAEEKRIALTLDNPLAEAFAYCDRLETRRVLMNLMCNAVANTPHFGSLRCRIANADSLGTSVLNRISDFEASTLGAPLKLDGHLVVSIQDSGIGIAREDLPNLFRRFGANRGRNPMSMGLGLYNCYQVIQAHNGMIWVETTEAVGTAVSFILPVNEVFAQERRKHSDRRKNESSHRGRLPADASQPEDDTDAGG